MPLMGIETLKQNLTNPARVYLWEILVPAPIGGGNSDVLTTRCQSTSIPGRSFGEIVVPYKQTAGLKFPGKLTYPHTWECTFIDAEDKAIFDAIYAWKQAIVDDFDGVGQGDNAIKQDIYLTLLTTTGEIYMTIKLVGAYPQEVGNVDLSYDAEDTVKFPVTWSYDRWEQVST